MEDVEDVLKGSEDNLDKTFKDFLNQASDKKSQNDKRPKAAS